MKLKEIFFILSFLIIISNITLAIDFDSIYYSNYLSKEDTPFAMYLCFYDLEPETYYDLKVSINTETENSDYISYVFDDFEYEWKYSNFYLNEYIFSDSEGEGCNFVFLKIANPDYVEEEKEGAERGGC